jgi:hypothetical protein
LLSAPSIHDRDRLKEIGAFIRADPGRAMAAAQLMQRGTPAIVESDVRGVSMGAALPDGARIRIASGDTPLRAGVVIAFIAGNRTIVHRIRHRSRGWLITQGDAMRLPDTPVPCGAVLGSVVGILGADGWQPLIAPQRLPRRDRMLSWLVCAASVALLALHPPLARKFLDRITRAEREHAWTSSLLY